MNMETGTQWLMILQITSMSSRVTMWHHMVHLTVESSFTRAISQLVQKERFSLKSTLHISLDELKIKMLHKKKLTNTVNLTLKVS